MKRRVQALVFALAAAGATTLAHADNMDTTADVYFQCKSYTAQPTIYFSGITAANGSKADNVTAAFRQMLAAKYGYKGYSSCSLAYQTGTTLEKLQSDDKSYATQLRAQGKTVIETGWTYREADTSLAHWCYGMVNVSGHGPIQNYFYETPVFAVPAAQSDNLLPQWRSYLKAQHAEPGAYSSLAQCAPADPDPAKTQANMKSWMNQWASQATIVRADWTYPAGAQRIASAPEPPAPPAPVAGAIKNTANAHPYFCTFEDAAPDGTSTRYFTGIFATENANVADAWNAYMHAAYHARSTEAGSCDLALGAYGKFMLDNQIKAATQNPKVKVVNLSWHP